MVASLSSLLSFLVPRPSLNLLCFHSKSAARLVSITSCIHHMFSRSYFTPQVVAGDGYTYEKVAIQAWLHHHKDAAVVNGAFCPGALDDLPVLAP